MIEDGTGIRHHAQAFGDVGIVIPPIILYRNANIKFQNDDQISRLDSSKPYSRRIDNY